MSKQSGLDGRVTRPRANEIEEVDVEVGFLIGCCCCSLSLEEDDDLEGTLDAMEEESPGEMMLQAAEGTRHHVRTADG